MQFRIWIRLQSKITVGTTTEMDNRVVRDIGKSALVSNGADIAKDIRVS